MHIQLNRPTVVDNSCFDSSEAGPWRAAAADARPGPRLTRLRSLPRWRGKNRIESSSLQNCKKIVRLLDLVRRYSNKIRHYRFYQVLARKQKSRGSARLCSKEDLLATVLSPQPGERAGVSPGVVANAERERSGTRRRRRSPSAQRTLERLHALRALLRMWKA